MFNKILGVISKFLRRTFCSFTLVTVAMALVGKLINKSEFSNYISVDHVISFLLFSLLFALSFGISDLIKNNSILRRFSQFILTYASVAVVFFAGGAFGNYVEANAVQNKGFAILAISFVFVIIYVVCGVVSLVASSLRKKFDYNKQEYEEMFVNK